IQAPELARAADAHGVARSHQPHGRRSALPNRQRCRRVARVDSWQLPRLPLQRQGALRRLCLRRHSIPRRESAYGKWRFLLDRTLRCGSARAERDTLRDIAGSTGYLCGSIGHSETTLDLRQGRVAVGPPYLGEREGAVPSTWSTSEPTYSRWAGVDPAIDWVLGPGRRYFFVPGDQRQWFPVLLQLNKISARDLATGTNIFDSQAERDAWAATLRVPRFYIDPPKGLDKVKYCTAMVTEKFLQLVVSNELVPDLIA